MSLYDFFHKYFNHGYGGNTRPPDDNSEEKYNSRKPRDPFWDLKNDESDMRDLSQLFDFKVMTDPFEMHQFFESKLAEMMKMFSLEEGFSGFNSIDILDPGDNVPAIKENQNPRDHYLKPGVDQNQLHKENYKKDDNATSSWLYNMLPRESIPEKPIQPNTFSSFRSVIRRTVSLPDGTVKTEEIIRNSDGTEERRESHTSPDGSASSIIEPPAISPDFSDLFVLPTIPEIRKHIPRDQFLKPGYEKFNPYKDKIDTDLDKQILQSGVDILPPFSKDAEIIQPSHNFSFKSITKRSVTLPSGITETEEIIRNSDGTEKRTVIHTVPDDTPSADKNLSSAILREGFKSGINEKKDPVGYNTAPLSSVLKGAKDLIDILLK